MQTLPCIAYVPLMSLPWCPRQPVQTLVAPSEPTPPKTPCVPNAKKRPLTTRKHGTMPRTSRKNAINEDKKNPSADASQATQLSPRAPQIPSQVISQASQSTQASSPPSSRTTPLSSWAAQPSSWVTRPFSWATDPSSWAVRASWPSHPSWLAQPNESSPCCQTRPPP